MKLQVVAILVIIIVALAGLGIYEGIIKPKTSITSTTTSSPTSTNLRIVSLAPSDTQILIALGLGKYIVGMDVYSYNLLKMLNMTSQVPKNVNIFPQIYPPNISGIFYLNPTVVIGEMGLLGSYVTEMEKAGLKVYLTNNDFASNFYEIERSIMELGNYFNKTIQAQQLVNWMNSKLQNFSTSGSIKTIYIGWINPNYQYYSAGGNVFINAIIQLAGGVNVLGGYVNYGPFTPDTLVQSNPQVIIVSVVYNLTYTQYLIESFPGIKDTIAYKEGKIYYLSDEVSYIVQEPAPLAVYAVLLFREIINGTAPHYISWNWIEENIYPMLPVY